MPVTVIVEVALLPGVTGVVMELDAREKLLVVTAFTVSVNEDDVLA